MSEKKYLAVDLGAESGRVMLGTVGAGKVELQEIHRFLNLPVPIAGSTRWDVLGLFRDILEGLRKAAEIAPDAVSISVDSWGVDYVWSGDGQPMLAPAYVYRDSRTDATYQAALDRGTAGTIFEETGIQFMAINTLYQMMADHDNHPGTVALADRFLNIADYFHFLLSGVAKAEESLASTTQIYNPRERDWSRKLIREFNFRSEVFPEIVPPGTALGTITREIAERTALLIETQVVATCSHDTGAAVAAVPAEPGENWAYLSSGTWSLIGVELAQPLISEASRAANFTNEGGLGGTTRFLKNITGLWILQECRRAWERLGQVYDYAELNRLATEAPGLRSLIDPNDERFLKAGDMPEKVAAYCRETAQEEPRSAGEFARCILESLALLYDKTLDQIQELTGRKIEVLHIVGGGSQSALLNQFAANATQRTVLAGPVESTALGNILIQAMVDGEVGSREELRALVRDSFEIKQFIPVDPETWRKAKERLEQLTAR